MCTSGGLAGGFVSHRVGQMMAGNGSSNTNSVPPRPIQEPVPTALTSIEPLKAAMVSEPLVNTGTLDQKTALKQKKLNQKKENPMTLTNTGLQIGGTNVESR